MLRRALLQPAAAAVLRRPLLSSTAVAIVARRAAPALCARATLTMRSFSSSAPASSASSDDTHADFKPVSKQTLSSGPDDAKRLIENDIKSHQVFLYMKGTPAAPRCGFSNNVCRILNTYPGVKYGSRDVLEDDSIREGIKQFSDWPTLPQLFVNGEFVGGSDIVSNMYKSGELDKILGAKPNKA